MVSINDSVDGAGSLRVDQGRLGEDGLAALVVALRCRAARAAASRPRALPVSGKVALRMEWQGHAPYEAVWSPDG